MEIEVNNIKELQKVIDFIKNSGKNIILLSGNLGSGKTTLVKEFVKTISPDTEATSPTFALQNVYPGNVYHYDLYNKSLDEFLSLGMLEELEKEGYHFIEWGEILEEILNEYGFEYLKISIKQKGNKRIFKCQN
jgi:tRNA threonylcarbamoyladenosine biosynthesis protein TsaE